MIQLQRHIEILLLESDCVIVPDFGGFMAHHVPAHYDEEECLFFPPSRTLGFNPQLRLNDSLLVQSYIEAYEISYPVAMRRIESEVEELKEHLHNDGIYELNGLGTLTVNAEGNYEFTPCEAGILSPSLYGLGTTCLQKRGDKRLIPDVDAQAALTVQLAEEGTEANVVSMNEETPDTQNQQTDTQSPSPNLIEFEDDDRTVSLKYAWIRNTVAAVAAAVLFFFIATPVVNSDMDSTTMSNIGSQVLYKLIPKDSNVIPATPVTKAVADTAAKAAASTEKAVDTKPTAAAVADNVLQKAVSADSYTIVVASQVKKSNAEAFVEQLHKAGHEDARLYINNNVVRVVLGSFATEEEAYKKLNSIQQEEGLEDAWIYKM